MDALAELTMRLLTAERVTVITGAGVSAASGIPTFRGADGLWRQMCPETLASPQGFARDPKLVWEWYDWRRQIIGQARPNAAHEVLAAWTRDRPGTTLVTQNVDGLHERAGSRDVLRLHGSIWRLRCWAPCPEGDEDWVDETAPFASLPPRCPHCGGLARPAVVWFGERLPPATYQAAVAACDCDVFLSIGTSAIVHPAAGLLQNARQHGAFTVEINPDRTEASDIVDLAIEARAEELLPRVEL